LAKLDANWYTAVFEGFLYFFFTLLLQQLNQSYFRQSMAQMSPSCLLSEYGYCHRLLYGGVEMLLMLSCQEYESRRGWRAIFHTSALVIVSQCDVVITPTTFIPISSVLFYLFCITKGFNEKFLYCMFLAPSLDLWGHITLLLYNIYYCNPFFYSAPTTVQDYEYELTNRPLMFDISGGVFSKSSLLGCDTM
jgi:hypothetical protein